MDTGLHSLVVISMFHQLPAVIDRLSYHFAEPGKAFSNTEILLAAKALTLRAKLITPALSKINSGILTSIAKSKDGEYFLFAQIPQDVKKNNPQTADDKNRHVINRGEVMSVSNDATVDEKLWLVYGMQIKMNSNTIRVNGTDVKLKPGMAVTAEVQTGHRRIIEFFMAPLLRHGQESLKER